MAGGHVNYGLKDLAGTRQRHVTFKILNYRNLLTYHRDSEPLFKTPLDDSIRQEGPVFAVVSELS